MTRAPEKTHCELGTTTRRGVAQGVGSIRERVRAERHGPGMGYRREVLRDGGVNGERDYEADDHDGADQAQRDNELDDRTRKGYTCSHEGTSCLFYRH